MGELEEGEGARRRSKSRTLWCSTWGSSPRLYSICGTPHRSVLAMLGMQARGVKVQGGGPPEGWVRERARRTAGLGAGFGALI